MEKPTLTDGVRAWAESRRPEGDHPSIEEIASYHAGELRAEDQDQLQEHVSLCPRCTTLLLDLDQFHELAPADVPLFRRLVPAPRVSLALAAVLAAAVVGLSVRVWMLQNKVDVLSRPIGAVHACDLVAVEDARLRGDKVEQTVAVPPDAERLVLFLHLAETRTFAPCRVELAEAEGGRVIWQGVARRADGTVPIGLVRSFLPPGPYKLRLYGLEGEERKLLRTYRIRVVHEDP